jgi:hypothetical protein
VNLSEAGLDERPRLYAAEESPYLRDHNAAFLSRSLEMLLIVSRL